MRYLRNIKVIGENGQSRLASSSVIIIGCGALGGQLAMLLAGAGIGHIGIADFDTIDISNLQRQLYFTESEAGKMKAEVLGQRIASLNSEIDLKIYPHKIDSGNESTELLRQYDIIVEATDNPTTKYQITETANSIGKPCVVGGVEEWHGQVVTLVNTLLSPVIFSDIFPLSCEEIEKRSGHKPGVMGPTPSTIASIQAAEVIKLIISNRESWKSKMITIDLLNSIFNTIEL